MGIEILFINFALAFALFLINGVIGNFKAGASFHFDYSSFEFDNNSEKNFSDNFFQCIIHPAIYVVVVSVIFQWLSLESIAENLWLVVPFFWCFRFSHIIVNNRISFANWRFEIPMFLFSLLLGEGTLFLIVRPLIECNETVFINLTQFRDAFWFATFTYLAKLIWDTFKHHATGDAVYPEEKIATIIHRRYRKFTKKYNTHILLTLDRSYYFPSSHHRDHFLCLLYAIMIYEDYNRPPLLRFFEYLKKIFHWNCVLSLGIMQVQTKKVISNKKSIALAIDKLYKPYIDSANQNRIYTAAINYNPCINYCAQVNAIYDSLRMHLELQELGTHRVKYKKSSTKPSKEVVSI